MAGALIGGASAYFASDGDLGWTVAGALGGGLLGGFGFDATTHQTWNEAGRLVDKKSLSFHEFGAGNALAQSTSALVNTELALTQTLASMQGLPVAANTVLGQIGTPGRAAVPDLPNTNRNVQIQFDGGTPGDVSNYTRDILRRLGRQSGNHSITITSTARNPSQQANAMFNNARRTGADAQREIYADAGDRVIDIFENGINQGLPDATIRNSMTNRIIELGPENVSRHATDPNRLNVIDISIRRLNNPISFLRAVRNNPLVRVLNENNVFHLEIPQLNNNRF